jgi:TonB family protein
MPNNPMSQPEPYGAPPNWDQKSQGEARDAAAVQYPSDVAEVARTLAAHGGGAASFDLALDLVLNEVVEQACLSTGATGAAIALARAGEMECRATTGAEAPELGSRLETTSGLSGACLQTGQIQVCGDTDSDARVNAEACRSLGVRSILILPLGDGKEPFGILEVFSPRPNAFGDRDISTLQILARRVVENKRRAEDVSAALPDGEEESPASAEQLNPIREDDQHWRHDGASVIEEERPRRNEVWTSILGILVILVAVLLGLALGWRAGIGRSMRVGGSPPADAMRGSESAGEQKTAPVGESATGAATSSVPQTRPASAATSPEPPEGGLQVTQNGKVIYRSPSVRQDSSTGKRPTLGASENASATRLIHRVEPIYPPEARAQHVQGAVLLDVQIGEEGAVHNIEVVEGNPVLAEAAVQAVRQWKYRPYSVDGRPVEMQTRVTIRFTLPPT